MKDGSDGVASDLFIIGGGINGCGIARDATGRGLSVTLAEQGDLAQGTSSASTKLFHGGLRYLEYFEFRLVREALEERETLLVAMPHISWPMRFVLPLSPDMRFESDTPTSRLLRWVMPWAKGRRPAWLIRIGLFMYDTMGGRKILPGARSIDLTQDPAGAPLKPRFARAFEFSDCWVEDSRLVVLNARDAARRGARILTRTRVVSADRRDGLWQITTEGPHGRTLHKARALVNAGGPWVEDVIRNVARINSSEGVRLVRVVRRTVEAELQDPHAEQTVVVAERVDVVVKGAEVLRDERQAGELPGQDVEEPLAGAGRPATAAGVLGVGRHLPVGGQGAEVVDAHDVGELDAPA